MFRTRSATSRSGEERLQSKGRFGIVFRSKRIGIATISAASFGSVAGRDQPAHQQFHRRESARCNASSPKSKPTRCRTSAIAVSRTRDPFDCVRTTGRGAMNSANTVSSRWRSRWPGPRQRDLIDARRASNGKRPRLIARAAHRPHLDHRGNNRDRTHNGFTRLDRLRSRQSRMGHRSCQRRLRLRAGFALRALGIERRGNTREQRVLDHDDAPRDQQLSERERMADARTGGIGKRA